MFCKKFLFGGEQNIAILDTIEQVQAAEAISLVVSCIPADKPIDETLVSKLTALLEKGTQANKDGFQPSLIEAAYKPQVTPVMQLAETFGWKAIPGAQMLVNQGERQFKIHTGFAPPYKTIYDAVVSE